MYTTNDNIIDYLTVSYCLPRDEVEAVFNHYLNQDMTRSKAKYYAQLACAALADQSII